MDDKLGGERGKSDVKGKLGVLISICRFCFCKVQLERMDNHRVNNRSTENREMAGGVAGGVREINPLLLQ